jgi:hypothetical protein
VVAALLVALGVMGLTRLAASKLHDAVLAALGPRATLDTIELTWRGIELRGLRIAAARGWPAKDELRAQRVVVSPDLRGLWSAATGGGWRVRRIDVDGGYLSLQRTRDGALRVLPALLGNGARDGERGGGAPALTIGEVSLRGAAVDFLDGSVRSSMHRLQLVALDADVGPLKLPALDTPLQLDVSSRLKGPRHDGTLKLSGSFTPATRDAALDIRAAGVDLVALQPYLLKVNDGGVKSGRLDLSMRADVRRQQLHAPGKLTLTDLELAGGDGVFAGLAGVPRQAVLAAMRRDGRIDIAFTLDGRLDDPNFSINDSLLKRVGSGLAESLGVSLGGVVEGVGNVIKGLLGR